ncbi:MAG: hypothetical protein ACFFDW_16035, partial [Candidatus Thorarchaeota archaeon]
KIVVKTLILIAIISVIFVSDYSLSVSNFENKELLIIDGYDITPYNITWWGGDNEEGSAYAQTDSDGNLYVTCFTNSFGVTNDNIYIIKYNHNMSILWEKTWTTDDDAYPVGLILDSSKNVYIAGTIRTEIETGVFSNDAFLLKYAPNGTKLWDTTTSTPTQNDNATDLAIAPSGNIFVVGQTNSSQGGLFLQKYQSNGNLLSTYYYGNTSPRETILAEGIDIDDTGNIFVVGTTDNTIPATNYKDLVLIKFNTTGYAEWNTTFGGDNIADPDDFGYDLVIKDNYIFLVGNYFDVTTPSDALIVKIDNTGLIVWNRTLNYAIDSGYSITLNHNSNPVIVGNTNYLDPNGNTFIAEYNSEGQLLWNSTWNSGLADQAFDVCSFENYTYSIGRSYNNTSTSYDVTIVTYVDPTWTPYTPSYYTPGIGGIIVTYILSVILGVGSIAIIGIIIFTYLRKEGYLGK